MFCPACQAIHPLHRHHDLAEVLVGFHVLERLADLGERIDLVDRQLQLAAFHRAPDVLADFVEDLADFVDGAGAEGDADILDAARGVQVEVEIAVGAAEAADIDDAALDLGRLEILVGDRARNLIDDQVDAFAVRLPSAPDRPRRDLWSPPRGRRRIPSAGRGASRRSRNRSRVWRP